MILVICNCSKEEAIRNAMQWLKLSMEAEMPNMVPYK